MWHYLKDNDFPQAPKELDTTQEIFCVNVLVTLESSRGRSVSEATYYQNANVINPKYVRHEGDMAIFCVEPTPEDIFVNVETKNFIMAGGDWDKTWRGPDYIVGGMGYCDDATDPVKLIAWMYPPEPARG